jgi:AcrR family transcriptional regulator
MLPGQLMRNPRLIKAKSAALAERRRHGKPRPGGKANGRIPLRERRERILEMASDFFAEYGLTAQTRALADACGISQRLLYRCFPSKGALIHEVYRRDIAGPFQATWLARLEDRSRPVAERLNEFYREYYDAVLTRRWLRLFLYASLAEIDMAPTYIAEVITRMLEVIVAEACAERGVRAPARRQVRHELGWLLHGAVSHLAIRRHIYANTNPTPVEEVIAMHVEMFLAGLTAALPARVPRAAQVVD